MSPPNFIGQILPTTRNTPKEFKQILSVYGKNPPNDEDKEKLWQAFQFGKQAHAGQLRHSGEEYFHHCIEVAKILIEMKMDTTTIVAAILHDVLEDTKVTKKQLTEEFDTEITTLVDGVTKLGGIDFQSPQKKQADNFRKLLLSVAEDIRVLIIKFADRMHNMRTINFLPQIKQRRIAEETLSVYAPLAHRMGMARIKWELEDLALKAIDNEEYNSILKQVKDSRNEREKYIRQVIKPISKNLKEQGIPDFKIFGRAKHYFSIYRKMKNQNRPFEDIFDLLAIRIIVPELADCYRALGLIHNMYSPIDHRFKDFIAKPKRNGYQSVHTTIIGPAGKMVEIQIRTEEMDQIAEEGIAAHWMYKEEGFSIEWEKSVSWLRQIVSALQDDSADSQEFMDLLKIDLFKDEIFVFTPMGDLNQLPANSTPVDFAYEVHTEIGNHCIGAKVNGTIVPLNHELQNGDRVEIITSSTHTPSSAWLKSVKTSKAKVAIKKWIKKQQHESATKIGKTILEKEFRKRGEMKIFKSLKNHLHLFGYTELNSLYLNIGNGNLTFRAVVKKLFPDEQDKADFDEETQKIGFLQRARQGAKGVKIDGVSNIMLRFAKCCNPVPGDAIVGFITRGKGVSIHRSDCKNISPDVQDTDRILDVEWDVKGKQDFMVRLRVEGEDRKNIIKDITEVLGSSDVNIHSLEMRAVDGVAIGQIVLFVHNLKQLKTLIQRIESLPGIISINRK